MHCLDFFNRDPKLVIALIPLIFREKMVDLQLKILCLTVTGGGKPAVEDELAQTGQLSSGVIAAARSKDSIASGWKGAGIGFLLAMVMFAGVRQRMEACDIPKSLKGLPITLVAASLVSLSFLGFSGLVENMLG